MKIIKIGKIKNISFLCTDCGTEFLIDSDELRHEGEKYSIACPLCDKEIVLNNDLALVKFLKKAENLKNKI